MYAGSIPTQASNNKTPRQLGVLFFVPQTYVYLKRKPHFAQGFVWKYLPQSCNEKATLRTRLRVAQKVKSPEGDFVFVVDVEGLKPPTLSV